MKKQKPKLSSRVRAYHAWGTGFNSLCFKIKERKEGGETKLKRSLAWILNTGPEVLKSSIFQSDSMHRMQKFPLTDVSTI